MRIRRVLVPFLLLLLVVSLVLGCDFSVTGPTYTKESLLQTLKSYGVTAHYPVDQNGGRLLENAKGDRYLLRIDYIDQYEVQDGWAEVYFYPDSASAYEDALIIRQDFAEKFHNDEKVAKIQGYTLSEQSLPLFQQGNVIVFATGVSSNAETLQRMTQLFGQMSGPADDSSI